MSYSSSGIAHLSEMGIDVWTPRISEVPKFQHHFFSDHSNKRTCCVVLKVGNEAAGVSVALLLDNMMLAVGLSRCSLKDDSLARENPKDIIEEEVSLDEILKYHTPDFLLLSGFKIHHLITNANEKKKSPSVLNLGDYDLSFYSIESLLELLENPVRKREVWQTLSKLQNRFEKVETK